jgi:hypothetical protein
MKTDLLLNHLSRFPSYDSSLVYTYCHSGRKLLDFETFGTRSRGYYDSSAVMSKGRFPPGVVNAIHGTAKTINFIIDEPEIKAISFVGGNRVGKYIYTRGSANGKRVQAKLGAKNHTAILTDAIKILALDAIVGAAFGACCWPTLHGT